MAAKITPRNKNGVDANEEKYCIFQSTLASWIEVQIKAGK